MATRAQRAAGVSRPRRSVHAPPHRDWFEITKEVRSELGSELFMLVRAVWLCSWTPASARPNLFRAKTAPHVANRRIDALKAAPADLVPDLRTLMRLSGHRPPPDSDAAEACENIAAWAQMAGFPKTALHFAEAAAAIVPKNPHFAFIAGRTNRLLGSPVKDSWRAEVFYDRATRYASHQLNWPVYIRAHLGYGRLLTDRGNLRAAVGHLKSAASACIDQSHDWLAAQTFHDVCGLYFVQGDLQNARRSAVEALRLYPRHNERFPIAVHDALFLFLVDRYFREVYPHLQQLFHLPLPPHEQVLRVCLRIAQSELMAAILGAHEQTSLPNRSDGHAVGGSETTPAQCGAKAQAQSARDHQCALLPVSRRRFMATAAA